jgi:hypothetical protein
MTMMSPDRIIWFLRAVIRNDAEAMRQVAQCIETHDDPKNLHPICCVGRLGARLKDSDRQLVEAALPPDKDPYEDIVNAACLYVETLKAQGQKNLPWQLVRLCEAVDKLRGPP